ncbi:MAG TPA: serine/threonine-protein kinase, partial [Prosthecobacter sp.]|nr:serine/threonine-protein kinase [Prosthecobacter sp.]
MNPEPTSSASVSTCPQCGVALPENAPQGLCPSCLLGLAAMQTDADTLPVDVRSDLPFLAEVAAAFPDLEVLDVIGQGGMSVVYRARQPRLDRVVALKILPKSLAATPGFPDRFTREGRVLARLKHPNIVTVHDFGESGGFFYLIMEHVDGVNLRQAMRAGRFTPEQALRVVPAMCEALQYAHGEGVLHRDIKPENILLDSKGRVKIADFGIAKIVSDKGGAMLTQSGAKLGTAPYMAPEQIEQPASVDHRADIYSLGVVFYEMLTGELPLGRFAAPSEKSQVGSSVDEIVFRALEKERERRQQSAGEMKTQIDGLSGNWSASPSRSLMLGDSFEYKSTRKLLGMPLVHVTSGIDPATGTRRVARGFFAFGDSAVGVFAFGGIARGCFACGGCSVGLVAVGGLSLGLLSWGGVALALLLAIGGMAVGPLATGGAAIGWHVLGGWAVGWHAYGGYVFAHHGMGGTVHAAEVITKMAELSAGVSWLHAIGPWTSLGAFLWLPLMLPMLLVPLWARRQLEKQPVSGSPDATDPRGRHSARILWLIPASLLLGLLAWVVMYIWITRSGPEQGYYLAPGVITLLGMAIMALCIPLVLRMVPMNAFYGIRIPQAYVSTQRWFDINVYGALTMAGWSIVTIAVGLVG